MIFFEVQFLSFVKRIANSTNKQQNKNKITKNVIDFYFQKLNLSIRFPSEIKVLSIDPALSNWFFIKKISMVKLGFFHNKPLSMCFCFFAYITLFQLSVGYVCLL